MKKTGKKLADLKPKKTQKITGGMRRLRAVRRKAIEV